MKKAILILFSSIIFVLGNAQNIKEIDSLKKIVSQSKNDSVLAENYNKISISYWSDNPQECRNNAEKALEHAKKCNSHRMMTYAYQNLGSAAAFTGNITQSLNFSKLAYQEAKLSKNEKIIMGSCLNLGGDYMSISKFDSADVFLDKGIEIAKKLDDKKNIIDFYINKGNCQFYQMNYDSCEAYYGKGLQAAIEIKDTNKMAMFYNNIAAIRITRGIADSTVINYLMNVISIYEKKKDYLSLGDSYATLGGAYNILKNDNKSVYYLKKGIESYMKVGNETKSVNPLVGLADHFREMNELDSAGYYADKAIAIGKKYNFNQGLAAAYCVKGIIYSKDSVFDKAESYLEDAFNEFTSTNYGEGIFLAGDNLINVYSVQNKNKKALDIALKLYKKANQTSNFLEKQKISNALSELYQKAGNYLKAYESLQIYIVAVDSLNKLQNAKLLEDMVTKYETQKKDNEILKLKNEKLIKEKKINQQNKIIYLIVSFFGILTFLFYSYRRKLKFKAEKDKLIFEQQLAEAKQEALNSQMSTHFISRTMDSINNFIQNNEKDKASKYLLLFNRLIRKVLENSFKKAVPLIEDLKVLEDYINLEKLRFIEGPLKFHISIDPDIDAKSTLIPPMVLQTLAENSIVHGFSKSKGGEISLNIKKVNDSIECVVEDNGLGIKKSIKQKGSTDTKYKSFGSRLAERLVRLFSKKGTKFKVTDSVNYSSGTRIEFSLPLIILNI